MDKLIYKTLLKNDHKFSMNDYVKGRIFGIAEIICELYGGKDVVERDGKMHERRTYYGNFFSNKDGTVRFLRMKCTTEQYERFKAYVEDMYPGLCEFYWNN